MTMKATLGPEQRNGKFNLDKPITTALTVVVDYKGSLIKPVSARMSMAPRGDTVYANIVVSADGYYSSGSGTATGSGYHKESAALDIAIDSAGITLSKNIDGVGDLAMEEALTAITRALGYRGRMTIVRNQ